MSNNDEQHTPRRFGYTVETLPNVEPPQLSAYQVLTSKDLSVIEALKGHEWPERVIPASIAEPTPDPFTVAMIKVRDLTALDLSSGTEAKRLEQVAREARTRNTDIRHELEDAKRELYRIIREQEARRTGIAIGAFEL